MAVYKNYTNTLGASAGALHGGELIRALSGEAATDNGNYTGKPSSGGKSSSGGKKTSGGGGEPVYYGAGAPAIDQTARLTGLFDELYGGTFSPNTVEYAATPEAELSSQIAAWLLPGYEQAIAKRREKTVGYAAELDAAAISRGMGASTFVTDVKSRQQRDEANDIAILQSEYGATLAKNVSERLSEEKNRALETDMFNAEARQNAYKLAYQAAVLLMELGAVAHKPKIGKA